MDIWDSKNLFFQRVKVMFFNKTISDIQFRQATNIKPLDLWIPSNVEKGKFLYFILFFSSICVSLSDIAFSVSFYNKFSIWFFFKGKQGHITFSDLNDDKHL